MCLALAAMLPFLMTSPYSHFWLWPGLFYTDRQIIALFLDCVTRSGYLARDQNLPRSNFFPRLNIVVFKLRKLQLFSTFLHCIKRNSTSMYRSSRNTKISFNLLEQKRSKPSPAFFNVQIQVLKSLWQVTFSGRYTLGPHQNEMY